MARQTQPSQSDPLPGSRVLTVRWPGGGPVDHRLAKPTIYVGRDQANDIVLNYPTISSRHLQLDMSPQRVQVTDLNSTNGTMLKGNLIPPGTPHTWRPGDVIRVGDLRGNSISMVLKAGTGTPLHTRRLGMHKLAKYARVTLGRDPSNHLQLDHPTISRTHAEIARQNGGYAIRDLGSTNGTFVNGQRVGGWVSLTMGDVIQVGPYKLAYDGQAQELAASVSEGHRLDAIGLGVQVSSGLMILQDIALSIQGGEFVALVGGSGAGKSTLLKAMNGYNPATHGRMLIDGEPLYPNLDAYRTLMGYVPQDDIIHDVLPVRLALWYAAKLRLPDATSEEINERITKVLDMVEMRAHAEKPVRVLSGGQRKRVSIAVELLAEPDMLFLDEPTSGLDPGLEKKMMYDLNRLSDQGRTVVLITHATANIEQCHHVAFLVRGRLAYYGPPREAIRFFQAQDFADVYLKLSEEVDPSTGKSPPSDLQSYYPIVKAQQDAKRNNNGSSSETIPAGLLWAEHYRHSEHHRRYVDERQSDISRRQGAGGKEGSQRPRTGNATQPKSGHMRDSALRQLYLLARRQFDLIRHDMRTLFILLIMMPIIASLFMAVSGKTDLTGWQIPEERIEAELTSDLEGHDVGDSESYMPAQNATQLITMLGLALTQAGTFSAAFEIVKEQSIFKREKAVNLRTTPYVLSKALVLGGFAIIQVASSLLILGIKVDMSFDPILAFFPSGGLELFFTLLIAVLASIMLGLFISAIIPSADVLMYIILVQLFAQIILSGGLFPLDSPVSKLVISHWTMDAMGSTVDVFGLDEQSRSCSVVEIPTDDGTAMRKDIQCKSSPVGEDELKLDYEHSQEHLLLAWGVLLGQAIIWCVLTIVVQMRKAAV